MKKLEPPPPPILPPFVAIVPTNSVLVDGLYRKLLPVDDAALPVALSYNGIDKLALTLLAVNC